MRDYNIEFMHTVEGDYVEATIDSINSIDQIAYRVVQSSPMEHAVPFSRRDKNSQAVFRYNCSGYISLNQRLDTYYTKIGDYLELGLQIVAPLMEARDYMTDYHDFVFSTEYVFYSESDRSIYYLLVPSEEFKASDREVMDYFREVLTRPRVSDAADFQIDVFRMFESGNVTIQGLYRMFVEEKQRRFGVKKSTPSAPKKELRQKVSVAAPAPKNEAPVVKPASPEPVKPETKKNDGNDINDLFGSKPKKDAKKEKAAEKNGEKKGFGLFSGKKTDKKDKASPKTPVKAVAPGPGKKMVLVKAPFPGAPGEVSLEFNKDHITIGRIAKDQPPCDVRFSPDFRRIGRNHAWIEKGSSGELYLIDKGSANHTLLNGEQLVPERKYLITNGAEITFSVADSVVYRVEY